MKKSWKEKFYSTKKTVQKNFPTFSIRSKSERPFTLRFVAFLLRFFLWLPKTPDLSKGVHLFGDTLWVGNEWERVSYHNRTLILLHEYRFMQILFQKRGGGYNKPSWWRMVYGLLRLWRNKDYRFTVLKETWHTNIEEQIKSSPKRELHPLVKTEIIKTLCGEMYFNTTTYREAKILVNLIEQEVKRNLQQQEEKNFEQRVF